MGAANPPRLFHWSKEALGYMRVSEMFRLFALFVFVADRSEIEHPVKEAFQRVQQIQFTDQFDRLLKQTFALQEFP